MTILFFGAAMYSIVLLIIALLAHENPDLTESVLFESDPEAIKISPLGSFFAFGLTTPLNYEHFLDETIYTFEVVYRQQTKIIDEDTEEITEAHSTERTLPIVHCTHKDAYGRESEIFE